MKNLIWYLKKHGNKSFEELKFNEIDALFLSQIGYLNLELFSSDINQEVFIKDVLNAKNAKRLAYGSTTRAKNEKLCKAFENTTRYDDIYFKHYRSILDNEIFEQFFGVTFFLKDFRFVVYRGTDCSLTGWQEDLNMAYMDVVPSQTDAVAYLNEIYELYPGPLYVGGHSKGGNLALYASIFTKKETQDSIMKIYDFDGPGFLNKGILKTDEYLAIKDKVVAVSATLSTVAMILYNVEKIEFLKSKGIGILQHDPYNWFLKDENSFKRVKRNSVMSRYFEKSVDLFFRMTTIEERKRFTDIFVSIAKEKPESSLLDFTKRPFRYIRKMIDRSRLIPKEDKKFYSKFYRKIFVVFTKALKKDKKRNKK